MAKSVVFRMWKFPGFCETFLINQVIIADRCGLERKFLVEDINNLLVNPHLELISKARIRENLLIEDYQVPNSTLKKFVKAVLLLLSHPQKILPLYRFLKSQKYPGMGDVFKFFFLINLNKFDIVHVQYGTNVKPLEVLKRIGVLSSRLIVSFHGHDLHFPINGKIDDQDYYREIFKWSDMLTTTTGYLKSLLISLGAPEDKIRMVPVAVDTGFFHPKTFKRNREVITLITVGRMDELKGQRFGIEVAKRLNEKEYSFQYILVGTGSHMEDLRDMIREYQLEEKVKLVGQKPQEDVRDLLQKSDIFLMTSIKGPGNSREGQGVVTAEAQACGLPVVAFDSGGVKYTFEDGNTGYLVPEKNVDEMTKAVEKLLNDNFLVQEMGRKAVNFVSENFSQEKITEKWCDLYNSI